MLFRSHALELQKQIKEGIEHVGFSLIEAICACPVIFGKLNKKGDAPSMMRNMRDNSITIAAAEKLPKEQVEGKIIRGTFIKEDRTEYTQAYAELRAKVVAEDGNDD